MNAKIDGNNQNSLIAGLNTDGRTIQRIEADPTTHRLHLNDGTSGTDHGPKNALIDDNFKRTLIAVSTDGDSIITAYGDSSSKLFVKST